MILLLLVKNFPINKRYDTGIAAACGSRHQEMNLVRQGTVNRFFRWNHLPSGPE